MSRTARVLRAVLLTAAAASVAEGVFEVALGKVGNGVGVILSGAVVIYVLLWLPRRAANGVDE